jgi:uncharacterized membrane protein required for colicin V production
MMTKYIFDVVIVLVLAFFAWRGAKRGLILTFCSLLALFVAYFGAQAAATHFAQPVANIIRPSIQATITEVLTGETTEDGEGVEMEVSPSPAVSSSLMDTDGEDEEETDATADFTLQQILDLLRASERFAGLTDYLEDAIQEKTLEVTTTAAAAVAAYLSLVIARAVLFGLSFVLILLVWFLVSRALDIAFKLPILSAVNAVGGLIFGLLKGVLIMLVLVWLARLAGFITDENAGPVVELMTVSRLSAVLRSLMIGG